MLDSFRPFARKFVDTTFEDYSKRHERSITDTVSLSSEGRRVDINKLYPYKHSDDEVKQRMKSFQQLKEKVIKQREEIKMSDEKFELVKQQRRQEALENANEMRKARRAFEQKLRKMADLLPPKRIRHLVNFRSIPNSTRNRSIPIAQGDFFALTAPSLNKTLAAITPSKLDRRKSMQTADSPSEGGPYESPTKSRLQQYQSRLASRETVKSSAFHSIQAV